jgi:hypothetical protein
MCASGRAFDSLRIVDGAAEHLIAAAQSEHRAAAAKMRDDIDVEAGVAQHSEIGDGCLRARQDDKVCIAGQRCPRMDLDEVDGRLRIERIEVVEIGDVR